VGGAPARRSRMMLTPRQVSNCRRSSSYRSSRVGATTKISIRGLRQSSKAGAGKQSMAAFGYSTADQTHESSGGAGYSKAWLRGDYCGPEGLGVALALTHTVVASLRPS